MPTQDWNRIKLVFSAALGVAPSERDAYLESACDGSPEVRRAVEELLRAHIEASQTFLEPSSIVLATSWVFREGDRVAGRFKVLKRLEGYSWLEIELETGRMHQIRLQTSARRMPS